MAVVYLLYSAALDKFYVGSCNDITVRLEQHLSHYFPKAFTSKAQDWVVYLLLENLSYSQARKIEVHIKKMKSRKYIENLKKYPAILEELISRHLV